jgi:hypothetical protein
MKPLEDRLKDIADDATKNIMALVNGSMDTTDLISRQQKTIDALRLLVFQQADRIRELEIKVNISNG